MRKTNPTIQTIKISELKPFDRNPRLNDSAVEAVAESIKTFGFNNPILIRSNKTIIAGHTRLKAAHLLGLTEAPCITLDHLTDVQAKAYNIADNRTGEIAEWDNMQLGELLAELKDEDALEGLGYDEKELDAIIAEAEAAGLDPQTDEDDVPEVPDDPITQTGDIILLGKHRLMCGDSTKAEDVEALMDGKKAALMVTDPPYGVDYDPEWRDEKADKGQMSRADRSTGKVTADDRRDWSDAYKLSDAPVCYVWFSDRHAAEVHASLEKLGYTIVCQIVWVKPMFAIGRGDYHWQHESCWYAVKKGENHNWQGSRSESTTWEIERGCGTKTGHGTEKPVECMERPVRNNTAIGQLVHDPFLGSGSTLIACEKTGRTCYGMEISELYCDVVVKRWEDYTGKVAKRLKRAA